VHRKLRRSSVIENVWIGPAHNEGNLWGGVMKKSLLLLVSAFSLCLLSACGGGGSTLPSATLLSVTAPATVAAGTAFNFKVTALDTSNHATTNYSGTAHFTSTDGQATLPANAMLTNGTGTFSATLKTAGSQTITVTDTVTVSITGTSNSINVSAGAASQFSVAAQATATAGTALNFTVNALDAWNNLATNYSGTVHFTSTDGQAVLPANSTLTNGTGTLSVTLNTTGSQTITATDSVTAAITGTSNSIQVSPPASGFTATGSMLNARASHTATVLNDGRVLVLGGMHSERNFGCPTCGSEVIALASAELYDPATGEFTSTGSMSVPRVFHTATLLGNGKVLVAGGDGRRDGTTYSSAELYDPATGVFTLIGNMMTAERTGHTATLLANGKVLLAGGADGDGNSLSTAEVFDPTAEEFTATGTMSVGRWLFTATLLNDGRVLVAGGICDNNGCIGAGTSSAELFDPATNTFALTASMTVERSDFTATLLTSGAVLVTGGATSDGVTATATAELFDPVTGTFALTGGMLSPRELHTATRLTDGKVIMTGGLNGNGALSSAELFDPANGSFTSAGNMETERYEHSGTLLTSGEVLITGGIKLYTAQGLDALATAELFP
jgi:Galactose oxidase, central domain